MPIFNYDLKTDDLTHRYSDVGRSGTSSYIRSLPPHELWQFDSEKTYRKNSGHGKGFEF